MYPVSCTNTHHDATDLINHAIVKNTKLEHIENRTEFFCKIKNA